VRRLLAIALLLESGTVAAASASVTTIMPAGWVCAPRATSVRSDGPSGWAGRKAASEGGSQLGRGCDYARAIGDAKPRQMPAGRGAAACAGTGEVGAAPERLAAGINGRHRARGRRQTS
jgi:hypothetical protein